MASGTRIAQLATSIHEHTLKVDEYLNKQGLKSPTFEIDSPTQYHLPETISATRYAVLEAMDELRALLLGPVQYLTNMDGSIFPAVHTLYRFPIASSFPVGEETTFAQISETMGLDEVDTRHLLRIAMSHHIFTEPRKGVVAHTAGSKVIAEMPLLRQYLGLACEEAWRGQSRLIDAITKWPGSAEPNETGLNIANNTDNPFFTDVNSSPERAKRFHDTMTFSHATDGFDRSLLIELYDWDAIGSGVVVDVGGSQGQMCIDLARRFPQLHCINQDVPDVIGSSIVPEELADRVELVVHDFFTEQPVKGADVYLFRWIFHDWADKYSVEILRNLIPALKKGAKIIIGDLCLPEPGAVSCYTQRQLRRFDLTMKSTLNGMERDADEWAQLFAKADSRFRFVGVVKEPRSTWAVIEATWQ